LELHDHTVGIVIRFARLRLRFALGLQNDVVAFGDRVQGGVGNKPVELFRKQSKEPISDVRLARIGVRVFRCADNGPANVIRLIPKKFVRSSSA